MKNNKIHSAPASSRPGVTPSKIRTLIFILEISLIIILLLLWLSSEPIRKSKSLWVLFFYNFPSQFLIAIVPHEPVFLYYSKFYQPLVVTFVAIAGTLITEILNYSVFKYVADLKAFAKMRHSKFVNKLVDLFNKAPFTAIFVAGFTPVPFYPFRFLVVFAHYPLIKYILAVFLSRTPRFFLIALFGHVVKIPDYLLILLFIVLGISLGIPLARSLLKKDRSSKKNAA
ncbi:MAG: VTT domain-containing protein [Candidatus Aminicenantaceae bacterium]